MLRRNLLIFLLLIIVTVVSITFFMKKESGSVSNTQDIELNFKKQNHTSEPSSVEILTPKENVLPLEKKEVIFLNSENFESLSSECLQESICEIEGEDPWAMYLKIKEDGQKNAIHLFISFLLKKIIDPKFRDLYKDALRKIIEDFYPEDVVDFQLATYYNAIGDLESSLSSYKKLEKKAIGNSAVKPNLSIANTYYDLGKYKEALSYYRASLKDINPQETSDDSMDAVRFINERIDLIKEKLR